MIPDRSNHWLYAVVNRHLGVSPGYLVAIAAALAFLGFIGYMLANRSKVAKPRAVLSVLAVVAYGVVGVLGASFAAFINDIKYFDSTFEVRNPIWPLWQFKVTAIMMAVMALVSLGYFVFDVARIRSHKTNHVPFSKKFTPVTAALGLNAIVAAYVMCDMLYNGIAYMHPYSAGAFQWSMALLYVIQYTLIAYALYTAWWLTFRRKQHHHTAVYRITDVPAHD